MQYVRSILNSISKNCSARSQPGAATRHGWTHVLRAGPPWPTLDEVLARIDPHWVRARRQAEAPLYRRVPRTQTNRVRVNASTRNPTVMAPRCHVSLPVSDSDGTVMAKPIGTR